MTDQRRSGTDERNSVELIVEAGDGDDLERRLEPVTCGIPWPRGVLRQSADLMMMDGAGAAVPLQSGTLDRWADGSVRWTLLDWQACATRRAVYRVRIDTGVPIPFEGPRVQVISKPGPVIEVDTGRATFRLGIGSVGLFESVAVDGVAAVDAARTRLSAEEGTGTALEFRARHMEVLEPGPIRSAVQIEGDCLGPDARPRLRFLVIAHFFAGSAIVRLEITLHNPAKADHPGGLWGLGAAGSIYLKQASLTLALPDGPGTAWTEFSEGRGRLARRVEGDVELYQDSSGSDNWQSTNHLNRQHVVPLSFRGYRLRHGSGEESGLRATPSLSVGAGEQTLTLAMRDFWQNFPKAIESSGREVSLRIFPAQFADSHEIQGGEQKTHVIHAAFGADDVASGLLEWCRSPLLARAKPSWYCASGAIPYLVPRELDPNGTYVAMVDAAIEGPDTFERKREVIDEYGWRHFGDVYGDHEAVRHQGPTPLVSHYNNQYDNVAGFAYQFCRSADRRWWTQLDELARHVVDIDLYQTDQDRSAYNRGMFWHTCHYVDADISTHRSYPASSPVGGGGPSGGHNYSTGLVLHHFLTGDRGSRGAAVDLARWVIRMDDGRLAPFGWLDGHPHGHATASGSASYHGPGRAPANSLNVLLNAYRLTRDRDYLEKAEQFIRRCIHPRDDINARDLLDAENKWFYTMFLQAIGRYLDEKEEFAETDRMYHYARESLLHYARWMAEHEYPYLDKPAILEYPTETWAAQDLRKSDVFLFAAKHALARERSSFLERADYFFQAATTTLAGMPTRTLARPVVLLLGNGFMRSYFQNHPDHSSLVPRDHDFDFGAPMVFIPQKARVIRKLKLIAALGGVLMAITIIWLAFVLARQ